MPTATIFADAPKQVRLPPRHEPTRRANIYSSGSRFNAFAIAPVTGSIAIMYGTLSTKPDITTETSSMAINPATTLPPVSPLRKPAKSNSMPVSARPPITINIPIKNKIVSQSSPLTSFHVSAALSLRIRRYHTMPKRPSRNTRRPACIESPSSKKNEQQARPTIISISRIEGTSVSTGSFSTSIFCLLFLANTK